ncbi:TadE/TadG family type IV pilus assembly protein [Solicola gregarius]|uniref:Pilus assembly protein n=1 Tax=Solicola gregarius TaxID=2908642 RepID=A0AA46TGL7_9ACTN|nr:TadE family protein [Solicola gregarius]UYM04951.1 pilus assembly protein [Solicola gregarius]
MATERGTASLELVILAPVMFAVLSLILVFGRYAETEGKIDQAARDGARAATAQNSRSEAETIARKVVDEALEDAPDSCRDNVDVTFELGPKAYEQDASDDPSEVSYISVRVRCDVDLTDLGPLPLDSATIDQTFTSPLDRYRGVAE